jgi:lysophospholipase L1-like esterase
MTPHAPARTGRRRFSTARFVAAASIAAALIGGSLLTVSAALAAPAPGVPGVWAGLETAGLKTARLETAGLEYVALGDSYSAGLGLAPPTGLPTPACGQSAVDFPHRLAAAYELALTDVSCSGAVISDVTTTAQFADAPPQISALSADTDIVTLTIGGNDLGFAPVAASCLAVGADGPLLQDPSSADCATGYTTPVDRFAARITAEIAPSLASTYAQIAAAAPDAEVFVLGYPSIFPGTLPEGGCFTSPANGGNSFPFTSTDTVYLHSVEQQLDAAIQTAAATAGFTYVPTFSAAGDNSACAPVGTAYVNGVMLTRAGADPSSLHPNALGVTYLTDSVSRAIDVAFPAVAPAGPTASSRPGASHGTNRAPGHPRSGTGADGALLAGVLAVAVLLTAGGAYVAARRRNS